MDFKFKKNNRSIFGLEQALYQDVQEVSRFDADIRNIVEATRKKNFVSPFIHTPELGQPRKREADPIIKGIAKGFSDPILGITEELRSAGDELKQGKIGEGGVDVLKGVLHTAMTPFTVPYSAVTEGIKGAGGEKITEGLNQVINLPFDVIKGGSELTAQGLNLAGIDTKEISDWLGISPELDKKANELVTEIGGLAVLMKAHKLGKDYVDKQAPEIKKITEPEFVIKPNETKPQEGITQEKLPTELIEKSIGQKIADIQQKVQEIRQEAEVKKKSVREERKAKILEDNKIAINNILTESPELASSQGIRILSRKLNSLVTQGKLSDKIDTETIKQIANEWIKNRPKPKDQVIKSSEVPLEEMTLPGFYGKNTNPSVGYILRDNPEFADLIKDIPRDKVYNVLFKALEGKRDAIKERKIEESNKLEYQGTPPLRETVRPGDSNINEISGKVKEEKVIDNNIETIKNVLARKPETTVKELAGLIKKPVQETKGLVDRVKQEGVAKAGEGEVGERAKEFAKRYNEAYSSKDNEVMKQVFEESQKYLEILGRDTKEAQQFSETFIELTLKNAKDNIKPSGEPAKGDLLGSPSSRIESPEVIKLDKEIKVSRFNIKTPGGRKPKQDITLGVGEYEKIGEGISTSYAHHGDKYIEIRDKDGNKYIIKTKELEQSTPPNKAVEKPTFDLSKDWSLYNSDISYERAVEISGIKEPKLNVARENFGKLTKDEQNKVLDNIKNEIIELENEKKSLLEQRKNAFVPDKSIYSAKIKDVNEGILNKKSKLDNLGKQAVEKPESVSLTEELTQKLTTPESKRVEKQPYEYRKNDFINKTLAEEYEKEFGKKPTEAELDKWMFRKQEMIGQIDDYHYLTTEQAINEGKIKSHPDYPELTKSTPTPESKRVGEAIKSKVDIELEIGERMKIINSKISDKKAQLLKKNIENLGRTSIGIDPESLKLVSEMIGLYAEKGIIKFEAVVQEAVKDLGEWVKPYVKKAWDERTTSIKNAKVTKERETRGLEPLEVKEVRGWDKVNKEAKDLIESGFDPNKLAKELIDKPRPLTDTEVSILTINREKIKQERNKVNEELATITDENLRAEKLKQSLELDEQFNLNDIASKQGGTESARGLGIRRMELKEDYSIAPLMQRARIANKNETVPDEVRIKLEQISRDLTVAEAKVKEYEEKILNLEAEKIIRENQNKIKFEQRTTKRQRKIQELDTEYQNLLKEFAKTTQFNALVDPKQIEVLGKIAKNRVEAGITSASQMVDSIYQDIKQYIPDLTKKDVLDAITRSGRFMKMGEGEIKSEINKIKRKVSDETLQKSYKTRLENRKAELEKMLQTGNFEKTPRRKTQMTPELSKLKDEVDLLKMKADKEIRLLELKNRTSGQKARDLTVELTNIPRTMMSSLDLSAPLRQGVIYSFSHPLITLGKGGAFREMFKYFGSDRALRELRREIEESPNAILYNKSGLYLANEKSNLHRLSGREEAYLSSLPEKIPVYGALIRGSERAYTGFLDKMRMDMFDFYVEQAQKSGVSFESNPKLYKDMAKVINTSTGRGTLGGFERSATALSVGLFSPRLIASRLQLINPIYYLKLDPFARKMAMKDMLKFIGVGTSILGLAKLAGADVEDDPRSTDFMKIKLGDTRLDVWGGFQQYGVLFTRMISGQTKNAKGELKKLTSDKYPFRNRWDVGLRFAEQKMSPFAGLIRDYFKGKDFEGKDFEFTDEFIKNITPLYLQDMNDAIGIDGIEGAFKVIPGVFGVGTQTYKPKEKINKYK